MTPCIPTPIMAMCAATAPIAITGSITGPTVACNIAREDIPGFPANQDANGGTYRRGKIWYARLTGGSQMVPVRMEFDTEFGTVEGYLAELRGHGVDLRFID